MSQEIDDLLEINTEIIYSKSESNSPNLFKHVAIRFSIIAIITIIGFSISNQSSDYDSLSILLVFGGISAIFHLYLLFEAFYFLIKQKNKQAIVDFVLFIPLIIIIIIFLS